MTITELLLPTSTGRLMIHFGFQISPQVAKMHLSSIRRIRNSLFRIKWWNRIRTFMATRLKMPNQRIRDPLHDLIEFSISRLRAGTHLMEGLARLGLSSVCGA